MKRNMRMFITIMGLAVLGLVAAGPISESDKLHEQMTPDEVKEIFNTEPPAVPEYRVVPIHWPRLHKRSDGPSTTIKLDAFNRNINLWLNPTEGTLAGKNTPVYFATSDNRFEAGVYISRIVDPMFKVEELWEDRRKQASVVLKRTADGRNLISGNIGSEGWVLRPLPDRFRKQFRDRYRKSTDNLHELKNVTIDDSEPEYHVIYKIPEAPFKFDYITIPTKENILKNTTGRLKRNAPSVIYPQILVLIDYETFKDQGFYNLLEYQLLFWNGVDLRYRSLEYPKVRLNIAGIIIARDEKALSFISEHKISENMVDIYGCINSLSKFMRIVEPFVPLDSYDIAIAMAPYGMCVPTTDGLYKTGILGLAFHSGACMIDNSEIPMTRSIAVIQDKGGFDGVRTAAHELGHLFGAVHDIPNSSDCSDQTGNIMAAHPILTEFSDDWSPCTLRAFDKFLNSEEPKCLFDKPKTIDPLPRVLPGRLLTADDQCAKIEGTKSCKSEKENICMNLRCVSKENSEYCKNNGYPAADGTTCDIRKICIHNKCVSEEDII